MHIKSDWVDDLIELDKKVTFVNFGVTNAIMFITTHHIIELTPHQVIFFGKKSKVNDLINLF